MSTDDLDVIAKILSEHVDLQTGYINVDIMDLSREIVLALGATETSHE